MVEMRWVFGSEPAPEIGENFSRKVKVLQYRYAKHENPVEDFDWSEWIDVPTVTEEK